MLTFVFKKILNNKWMILCLIAGAVLTMSMISSIPIYSHGILQRMLTKDLEGYQKSTGTFPGNYNVEADFFNYMYKGNEMYMSYRAIEKNAGQMAEAYQLNPLEATCEIGMNRSSLVMKKLSRTGMRESNVNVRALKDMEKHIKLTYGRMYKNEDTDGVYEVIVTEKAINDLILQPDEIYTVNLPDSNTSMKIRVVGIFDAVSPSDTFWYDNFKNYNQCVFMDYDLLSQRFSDGSLKLTYAKWNYAFDYHKIGLDDIDRLSAVFDSQQGWLSKYTASTMLNMSAVSIFKQYIEREKQLTTTLWVLIVPVLILLSLYIFMVSQMIVRSEENEIAVLKSRGISGFNIFKGYLLESVILGGIAIILGPPLGIILCSIIGASDGFMEFVQRSALPLSLSINTYLYAIIAFVLFTVTMSIPAYNASRTTIVLHKQSKAKGQIKPFWKRFYLDLVVLALSFYGLYRYYSQQKVLNVTGINAVKLDMDPFLFLITTFFVLGVGMLFLRLFPYIVSFVFRVGRKFWSPGLYATFIQVSRSNGSEQFLIIFMVLSLAMGIFSANSARTINSNIEDKINYQVGADIALKPIWGTDMRSMSSDILGTTDESYTGAASRAKEPPFKQFKDLTGVADAARVYTVNKTMATVNDTNLENVQMMGIDPADFGNVINFRDGLLPHHINDYLNLIADAPNGFLVSKGFKDTLKAKVGDPITVTFDSGGAFYNVDGIIYGFIDYWPTFNPNYVNPVTDSTNPDAPKQNLPKAGPPNLIVGNLSYIQKASVVDTYQVWLKKKPGALETKIYQDLESKRINVGSLTSVEQLLINKKNDPMLQGINGILTLDFIIMMLICMIGFLIFWVLSIKGRVLQFGIFRAMGLPMKSILGMIGLEQIFISGTAIFAGIMIGGAASDLFIPMLQLIYSAAEQVPPFKVTAFREDYLKIYIIVALMLITVVAVLRAIIKGIKVNQAIKLGEE